MMKTAEDLLTIPQAGDALHVSVSTIRRWISSGQLRAYRIGPKRLMVRAEDLQDCVQSTQAASKPRRYSETNSRIQRNARYRDLGTTRLTAADQERGRLAIAAARELHERLLAERAGVAYPDSAELIADARVARTNQLDRERFLRRLGIEPPSEEERKRGHEAFERATALRARLLAARGGVPFSDSADDLLESRRIRSEELS